MDYVELHFNGSVLRALNNPQVELQAQNVQFPAQGSRDALCQAIGVEVEAVTVCENVSLRLSFASGLAISVPLDSQSQIGPEALHWCPRAGSMEVW
jgi:hypothetical protein